MASVVVEFQRDALDPKIQVSDLLRNALVDARKLSLAECQAGSNWSSMATERATNPSMEPRRSSKCWARPSLSARVGAVVLGCALAPARLSVSFVIGCFATVAWAASPHGRGPSSVRAG